MPRRQLWSILLVPSGLVAGHVLGYRLAHLIGSIPAADDGHGHLAVLWLAAVPLSIAVVARGRGGRVPGEPVQTARQQPAVRRLPPSLRGRSGRLVLAGTGLVVAALVAVAVVARDDGGVTPTADSTDVHELLCAALGAAAADDFLGVPDGFANGNASLDELAADVERVDPAVAAELVEAKQAAVAALAGDAEALRTSLAALMPAVRDALGAVGNPVPPPCTAEG